MKDIKMDPKLLKRFEKKSEAMQKYWTTLHKEHTKDTEFTWFNNQWDAQAKEERSGAGRSGSTTPLPPRPTLVFNISKPFIVKVINGVKKMRPSLKVAPMDGATDVELAEVRRGILKSIEKNTGAIPARLQALKDAVTSGYGFYRFDTDYANPRSHDQEIKYRIIEDATTVLWDDNAKEPNGSDVKDVQIQEKYGLDEFETEFGMKWEDIYDASVSAGNSVSSAWGGREKPIVTEWWYIDESPETLVTINGKNEFLSEAKKMAKERGVPDEMFDSLLERDDNGEVIQRATTTRKVFRCKMAGKKILEKEEWKGYYIPVFKIDGRKTVSQGKVRFDGLSRDTQPSQKAYNYARNGKLERMALSPKNPWFYAEGSLSKANKMKMDTANTRNWASIAVKAFNDKGEPNFQPYRGQPMNVDPGLIQEEQTSSEEIKATLGMFGSYMGDTQGEKSGRAILAGAAESSDITFDFAYNMGLTMSHEGTVIDDLIPKVYDTARQVRMVGEDDVEKVVMVNQKAQDEKGKEYYYDMKVGKFDISYSMAPSNETKRAETRESIEVFMKALPEFAFAFADIYAEEQDWRKSDVIAKRLRKLIEQQNPGLIEKDDEEQQDPQIMQLQQALQEVQVQMQEMAQENEALKVDKSNESQKIEYEKQSKEEVNEIADYNADSNRMKIEAEIITNNAKIQLEKDKLTLERDKANLSHTLELAKLVEAKEMRDSGANEEQQAESQKKHETELADTNTRHEAIIKEISSKEQSLPPINITVPIQMPGKSNATITPKKGGGYEVKQNDAKS